MGRPYNCPGFSGRLTASPYSSALPRISLDRMSNFDSPLSKKHKQVVAALCTTYGLLYFGRVNISVVLPIIAVELDVGRAEIGILGTVFFWVYAIGNFVNGEIGSHVSPFRLVGLGLLVTAIVNIAFGFQTSLLTMLILWGINGFAQSGGWPPIVRILAERLDPRQIKRVSTVIPFSYVIGTVVTWTLIGAVAAGGNWRIAFWLPGLVLLLTAALWRKGGIDAPTTHSSGVRLSTIIAEARAVAFALVVSALAGFVRNGSIIWLPTFILDSELIADNLVGALAAITQMVAIPGLMLAHHRVTRTNQVLTTAVLMLGAAGARFPAANPNSRRAVACDLMPCDDALGWRLWLGHIFHASDPGAAGSRFLGRRHPEYDGDFRRRPGRFQHWRLGGTERLGRRLWRMGYHAAAGVRRGLAPTRRGRPMGRVEKLRLR